MGELPGMLLSSCCKVNTDWYHKHSFHRKPGTEILTFHVAGGGYEKISTWNKIGHNSEMEDRHKEIDSHVVEENFWKNTRVLQKCQTKSRRRENGGKRKKSTFILTDYKY